MTKKTKIEQLTPEQEDLLPQIRDKWLSIGLATGPGDREKVHAAMAEAYRAANLDPPAIRVWLRSPLEGAIGAAMLSKLPAAGAQVRDQVWDQVRDQVGAQVGAQVWDQVGAQVGAQVWAQVGDQVEAQVRDQVWDQVGAQVGAQVWDQVGAQVGAQVEAQVEAQVRDQVWESLWGQHDAGWLGWTEAHERIGVRGAEQAAGLRGVAEECGWWWSFRGAYLCTDRPAEIHLDDEGQLHNETGAALLYSDGFGVWAINGVRVPRWIIEQPETITVEKIKAEGNAEIRRIMRERYGDGRYLTDIGAKVIDADTVPTDALAPGAGAIHRALIEDDEGLRFLVGSDGSTDRVYYMPCDRRRPPATCVAAYEQLNNGLRQEDCILEA